MCVCVCVCTCTFVCMFLAILFLTQEGEKENTKTSPSYRPQCHISSAHGDKGMVLKGGELILFECMPSSRP